MLEEKETLEEKLALSEYELRLAQEDILKLKTELEKKSETPTRGTSGMLFFYLLINLLLGLSSVTKMLNVESSSGSCSILVTIQTKSCSPTLGDIYLDF